MNAIGNLINQVEAGRKVRCGMINDNTFELSSHGYVIQDHLDAEGLILKSGLFKYDYSCLQNYDGLAGITYTRFKIKNKDGK